VNDIPPAGAHGGDGYLVARALGLDPRGVLDLSVSLNPVAPEIRPLLLAHLESVARYPDLAAATAAMSQALGRDRSEVLLTNGGSEAIHLLASDIGGRVDEPEFSLYPRSTDVAAPLWRSNPNNPTGLLASAEDRASVWDEAFYPLATGSWTRGDGGSAVVGSLTKLLACPGLRVGFLLADPERVARCAGLQPAWSVNGLAGSALPDLLDLVDLPSWAVSVKQLRQDLVLVLESHGLHPRPSDANWVLADDPGLREALAPHGIVVRDCSSFGMPGTARIAVPSPEGLERLDDVLKRVRN
jgi:histidinol-phosphate/aromatic aminotransferase/cobyric acid decarboxylase-like protein